MRTGASTKAYLHAGAVAVGLLATLLALRSFVDLRPAWGVFNLAIALVGLVTFVAVRARGDAA